MTADRRFLINGVYRQLQHQKAINYTTIGLSPAERILNRLSFLKMYSAVRLRFLFRPQTTSMFGLSVMLLAVLRLALS